MIHRFVDIPPVWLAGFALPAWVLARLVPILSFDVPDIVGWLICAAGFLWAVVAGAMFLARRTPVEPRHAPIVLLADGPFRLNRNPIYTGMAVALVGWGLILGALSAFLPAIIFPFVITARFIRDEEKALIAAFGDEARNYLARTRRW